mgnify:CR=1 FL=1
MNNMLKIITTLILFSFTFNANADGKCTSGNCYNGKGTMTYANGYKYDGYFVGGIQPSAFTYTNAYGDKIPRRSVYGVRSGKGTMTYANGTVATGYFVNDKYWGTVAEWDAKVAKKKAYDKIYSACITDISVNLDMQAQMVRNAVGKQCSSIAENPSWYENFKYN